MTKINAIISPCCDAFLEYIDCNCICTKCGKNVFIIDSSDSLTTSIVYNISKSETLNMSNDLLLERLHKFKRSAHDYSCALTSVKCNKCSSLCRMSRNQAGIKIFVCTKCRNVFTY